MGKENTLEKLKESIVNCNIEGARESANEVLKLGLNPIEVIEKQVAPAIRIVGDRFESGQYFLTHLMIAADAMDVVTKILTSKMNEKDKMVFEPTKVIGKIVIGTVKGDIHNIGKNMVSLLLRVNGFKIYDLGTDVEPMEFIKKAEEVNADIIALSSLMSTTLVYQAEVINFLNELKLKDKYKVIVGGGPTTQKWAEDIGADGWAHTASDAVVAVKNLLQAV